MVKMMNMFDGIYDDSFRKFEKVCWKVNLSLWGMMNIPDTGMPIDCTHPDAGILTFKRNYDGATDKIRTLNLLYF